MAFRRVAYHRSWFMVVVGTIALVSIVANSIYLRFQPVEDLVYLALAGSAIAVLMIVRGFTGEWGKRQLYVDVAGGKLRLPDGSLRDLDNLGALSIEKKAGPRSSRTHRVTFHEYRLRADNVEYYLFDSVYESETMIRYHAVAAAVLQYRLRRILERPIGDGSAFRAGPAALDAIRAEVADRDQTLAALHALSRDGDAHVRAQATQVAAALGAG